MQGFSCARKAESTSFSIWCRRFSSIEAPSSWALCHKILLAALSVRELTSLPLENWIFQHFLVQYCDSCQDQETSLLHHKVVVAHLSQNSFEFYLISCIPVQSGLSFQKLIRSYSWNRRFITIFDRIAKAKTRLLLAYCLKTRLINGRKIFHSFWVRIGMRNWVFWWIFLDYFYGTSIDSWWGL